MSQMFIECFPKYIKTLFALSFIPSNGKSKNSGKTAKG